MIVLQSHSSSIPMKNSTCYNEYEHCNSVDMKKGQ